MQATKTEAIIKATAQNVEQEWSEMDQINSYELIIKYRVRIRKTMMRRILQTHITIKNNNTLTFREIKM